MNSAKKLLVYWREDLVGEINQHNGKCQFTYAATYIHAGGAKSISTHLPLQAEPFTPQSSEAFFSGLLPDDSVRRAVARTLKLSPENTFALLHALGGECAGAICILEEGVSPSRNQEQYKKLSEQDAYDILQMSRRNPLLVDKDDVRLSLGGAQSKMPFHYDVKKGVISLPLHGSASTHIFKPQIGEPNSASSINFPDSVHNELFCMRLAQEVGLSTPKTEIVHLCETPFYVVERYDRFTENGRIQRLHQEDFCQAIGIPPEQKYQNEGGPSLQQCFAFLQQKSTEGEIVGVARLELLRRVIFNFCIGNGDAHGKNFSILESGAGYRLAPAYDLLCTQIYGDKRMAMKLGGKKYDFFSVKQKRFRKLADDIGWRDGFVVNELEKLAKRALVLSEKLADELNKKNATASRIYEEIIACIKKNVAQLNS